MLKIKEIKNQHPLTKTHIRLGFLPVKSFIQSYKKKGNNKYFNLFGEQIADIPKLKLFNKNYHENYGKCKCELCGVEASYVVIEKNPTHNRYHLQMYTVCKNTKQEILFNIDHIIPKSAGGKDVAHNYQLTCDVCNRDKGGFTYRKYNLKQDFGFKSCYKKLSNLLTLLGNKSSAFFSMKGFNLFSVIKQEL